MRLDHAVLAVPYLCPAACRIHGAVGHRAVQVVGEGKLDIVFGGRGVLVEAVRRIGPRHAPLGRRDPVSDVVVGVGVRVGGVHIGLCPCQLASVVVGVGDSVGQVTGVVGTITFA